MICNTCIFLNLKNVNLSFFFFLKKKSRGGKASLEPFLRTQQTTQRHKRDPIKPVDRDIGKPTEHDPTARVAVWI